MRKIAVVEFAVLLSVLAVTAVVPQTNGTRGVLLGKPRITREEAIQIARKFLEDSQAKFTRTRFNINRAGCWFPQYELKGPFYSAYINARTGDVNGLGWWARKWAANDDPRAEGSFPMEKAIPVAREFLRRKFPGFDDSFEMLWQRHDEVLQTYRIYFGKTSNGVCLSRRGEAEISTRTGEVVGFFGNYQSATISLKPGISAEKAIEIAKSLVSKPTLQAEAKLDIVTDAIGEHLLKYRVILRHGERVNIISGGKREVESIHTTIFLDARDGKFPDMFVPLGGKPNLKKKIARELGVVLNGHEVGLMTPPLVRRNVVLIPDTLFEALGGEVSFTKSSGKIVLSKGKDPATLKLGKAVAEVEGKRVKVPAVPELVKGTLFFPAMFVESILRMKVNWDREKSILFIEAPDAPHEDPIGGQPYLGK